MPRPYSTDLRERAVEAVESGGSRREIAEMFKVGVSSVIRWCQRWSETGSAAPKRSGGSVSPLEEHSDWILALIAKQPDLTLEEILAVMALAPWGSGRRPCETAEICKKMDIWHPAYPTLEFGGLVFLYMGPPDTKPPLLPMFDIIDTRHRTDVVLVGKRLWDDHALGYVRDCNWLQHFENAADPYHLVVLHEMISGDQFKSVLTTAPSRRRLLLSISYLVNRTVEDGPSMPVG